MTLYQFSVGLVCVEFSAKQALILLYLLPYVLLRPFSLGFRRLQRLPCQKAPQAMVFFSAVYSSAVMLLLTTLKWWFTASIRSQISRPRGVRRSTGGLHSTPASSSWFSSSPSQGRRALA